MHRTLALTHSSASLWTPQSRQLGVAWKVELGTDKKVPNRNFGAACAISSSQDDVHSSYNAIPGCSCLVLPPNAGVSDKPGPNATLHFTGRHFPSLTSSLPISNLYCSFLARQFLFLLTHTRLRKATCAWHNSSSFHRLSKSIHFSRVMHLNFIPPQAHHTLHQHAVATCNNSLTRASHHPDTTPMAKLELRLSSSSGSS
jgi:hypothetical protein